MNRQSVQCKTVKYSYQLGLGLIFFASTVFGANFSIMTEELPPFNYSEDGKVTGFSSEIVLEISERVGHPKDIQVMPWARAYKSILNDENKVLFSTTRTPQREELFKWVGPIYEPTIVFFAKKGSGLSIKSLDDAKTVKRVGTYLDDAEETLLKEAGFDNLASVGDDFLNPKKLLIGRIDLWIAGDLEGIYKAKKAGLDSSDIEIVYEIKTKEYYIAFSKDTPDEEIQKWQAALDAMRQDGTYEKILDKYL
jgi:ABC-type amino acid transport substrate-binding protein